MTKNAQVTVPEIIDSVEALTAKMAAMREAQKVFATYTQEQVDKIFYEAAKAANHNRREACHHTAPPKEKLPSLNCVHGYNIQVLPTISEVLPPKRLPEKEYPADTS